MANSIAKFKKYVPLLDEVYQKAALTSVLDSDASLAREGANANEIVIPKIDMDGLGDYDRNSGYTDGDVTFTNETVQFNYERGRSFNIDAMDDEETAGLAYGKLAGEFIRTKVAPEGDAFRFAKYAGKSGVKVKEETLSTGADVISALRTATTYQDEKEVNAESRYLFITPTLNGLIADLDTTKSKEVLKKFADVIEVPQSRFFTTISLKDGKTVGEEKGGYIKTPTTYKASTDTTVTSGKLYFTRSGSGTSQSPYVFTKVASPTGNPSTSSYYEVDTLGGLDINFMIIEKSAVMQYNKHIAPKVVTPEQNQSADAWKFGYRKYGLADVYANKLDGIYVSYKPLA